MMNKITYNSPVVLTFTFLSFGILILGNFIGETTAYYFFSIYTTSFVDPMQYVRLFTHILGHANLEHWFSNVMFILLLGPMIEEKYGSKKFLFMILVTAFTTGILSLLFFNVVLLGASGFVFMLILLSSFTNMKKGEIPLTLILVSIIFVGKETINGLFLRDNVSQFSHIIGGSLGYYFGKIQRK